MEIMAAERSRPSLHNFKMPRLQWGNQRLLRCMNVDRNDGVLGKSKALGASKCSIERSRKSRAAAAEGDGIEVVRERLMVDLQEAAEKIKDAILREGSPAPEDEDGAVRPWNLRTRRAACKASNGTDGGNGIGGVGKDLRPDLSPLRSEGSRRGWAEMLRRAARRRERGRDFAEISRRRVRPARGRREGGRGFRCRFRGGKLRRI